MKTKHRQRGFSLLETLLAVGTLAIGMVFVAGTFLAGTFFTTVSSERTVAITVADEAFAKIRLYASGPWGLSTDSCSRTDQLWSMPRDEYVYPSTGDDDAVTQYSWRALCRAVEDGRDLVQCTVFVSRRVATKSQYFERIPSDWANPDPNDYSDYPELLRIDVEQRSELDDPNDLVVISSTNDNEWALINDGAVVVDDDTGAIYRVLERLTAPSANTIKLDRPWVRRDGTEATDGALWVLSPSAFGGRNPFVAAYQTVFELRRR